MLSDVQLYFARGEGGFSAAWLNRALSLRLAQRRPLRWPPSRYSLPRNAKLNGSACCSSGRFRGLRRLMSACCTRRDRCVLVQISTIWRHRLHIVGTEEISPICAVREISHLGAPAIDSTILEPHSGDEHQQPLVFRHRFAAPRSRLVDGVCWSYFFSGRST